MEGRRDIMKYLTSYIRDKTDMHNKLRDLFIEVAIFTNNNLTGQVDARPLQPSPKPPIPAPPFELFLSTGTQPYLFFYPLFTLFLTSPSDLFLYIFNMIKICSRVAGSLYEQHRIFNYSGFPNSLTLQHPSHQHQLTYSSNCLLHSPRPPLSLLSPLPHAICVRRRPHTPFLPILSWCTPCLHLYLPQYAPYLGLFAATLAFKLALLYSSPSSLLLGPGHSTPSSQLGTRADKRL